MDIIELFIGLDRHLKLYSKCVEILKAHDHIQALMLSGSFLNRCADEFSDIDFNIIVDTNKIDEIFRNSLSITRKVGRLVSSFHANHLPFPNHMMIAFYEVGKKIIKIDFDFVTYNDFIETVKKWPSHRITIFDKTDSLENEYFNDKSNSSQISHEELFDLNSKFWGWSWYSFGKIMRGEFFEAFDGIYNMRKIILNRIILNLCNMKNEGFRRIEEKYPADLREKLGFSYAKIERDNLIEFLLVTVQIYKYVKRDIEKKYNFKINNVKEEVFLRNIESYLYHNTKKTLS